MSAADLSELDEADAVATVGAEAAVDVRQLFGSLSAEDAATDSIAVDQNELVEARWFTRDEVVRLVAAGSSRVDSIEHFLVGSWLRD